MASKLKPNRAENRLNEAHDAIQDRSENVKKPTETETADTNKHSRLVDSTEEFLARGYGSIGIVGAGRAPRR